MVRFNPRDMTFHEVRFNPHGVTLWKVMSHHCDYLLLNILGDFMESDETPLTLFTPYYFEFPEFSNVQSHLTWVEFDIT